MNSEIYEKIQEEKGYLKGLALSIRNKKHEYKNAQREHSGSYTKLRELQKLQYDYRSHHIAYSIRKKVHNPLLPNGELTDEAIDRYNQIEKVVRDGNEPDWNNIGKILEAYPSVQEVADEEAVCAHA